MKRVIGSIGLLLLCCSTAAFASNQTDLAAFLASLKSSSPTPAAAGAGNKTPPPGGVTGYDVTCTATCGSSGSVSCTTSGSCSAVDRNCAVSQQGYVECNGSYTYCPEPCGCPEGQIIYEDGGCCLGGRQRWERYKCIDGAWEFIGNTCSGTCF